MKCQVCGRQPRQFELFGGGYWRKRCGDLWICPVCDWWAERILGRGAR